VGERFKHGREWVQRELKLIQVALHRDVLGELHELTKPNGDGHEVKPGAI